MKPIKECRGCYGTSFEQVVDLGIMAFTGIFPREGESVPRGPLVLVECEDCSLVQLSYIYDPEPFFGEGYGYRSSLSEAMKKHLREFALWVKPGLDSGDVVVDIGSNDGTLLNNISGLKADLGLIGFDFLADRLKDSYASHIRRVAQPFSADNFNLVASKKAKLITSLSMLYDVNDLREFISNISECLDDKGTWITEQNYLPMMIQNNALDFIGHEHATYLTMKVITDIAQSFGMFLDGFQFNKINGGSVRMIFSKNRVMGGIVDDSNIDFPSFNDRCLENGMEILKKLEFLKKKWGNVYGLGASTRGNTLLQYLRLTEEDIHCFLEINPDKFGKVTPGTNILILDEHAIDSVPHEALFILPWSFRDSFVEKYKGIDILFPLPNAEIVEGKSG